MKELDEDDVRRRAYEISQLPGAGTPDENWIRAVDELRAARSAEAAAGRSEPGEHSPFPPNTAALTHP